MYVTQLNVYILTKNILEYFTFKPQNNLQTGIQSDPDNRKVTNLFQTYVFKAKLTHSKSWY